MCVCVCVFWITFFDHEALEDQKMYAGCLSANDLCQNVDPSVTGLHGRETAIGSGQGFAQQKILFLSQ